MFKYVRSAALLSAVWAVAGCASITQGTDQQVTAKTEPSGAKCEFRRDGETLGVVNPTPGTITVSKSKDTIKVECEKSGRERAVRSMDSEFEGMTAGNALFGGLIGVGVDAASGAMHEYPTEIFMRLPDKETSDSEAKPMSFKRRHRESKTDSIS